MQDLTTRQFEVIRFIFQHRGHPQLLTYAIIGKALFLTRSTIGYHVTNLRTLEWLDGNNKPTPGALAYFGSVPRSTRTELGQN